MAVGMANKNTGGYDDGETPSETQTDMSQERHDGQEIGVKKNTRRTIGRGKS